MIRWRGLGDRLGMVAAIGCGIHCAMFSVLLMLYPALWMSRSFRHSGLFLWLFYAEWVFLAMAWLLVAITMIPAIFDKRRWAAPVMAATGLLIMTVAIVSPVHGSSAWVSVLALAGGLLVAAAHIVNLRHLPPCPGRSSSPE